MSEAPQYRLHVGLIQAYVIRNDPFSMVPFGVTIINSERPVLSPARRALAQPIIDRMNSGELTLDAGVLELNKHAFTCGDETISSDRPILRPKPPK